MSPIGTIDGPGPKPCILSRTGSVQNIPDSTFTNVLWPIGAAEVLDLDNWHSSSFLERITPQFATGFFNPNYTGQGAGTLPFLVTLYIKWDTNTVGQRRALIYKNGTTLIADQSADAVGPSRGSLNLSEYVMLGVGDYVVAEVWQNSGAARTLDAASTFTLEVMGT